MEIKVNAGGLTRAIADCEIAHAVNESTDVFHQQATELIKRFSNDPPTPQKTNDLENHLHEQLRELGRRLIE